jgi:DNA-binding CsgD family transcriptional regulator
MNFIEPMDDFPGEIKDDAIINILNKINTFICIIDVYQGRLLWANRYFLNKLGYSKTALPNITSDELLWHIHPDFREVMIESLKKLNGKVSDDLCSFCKIRTKSNRWTWILSTSMIFEKGRDGQIKKILLCALEINLSHLQDQMRILISKDIDTGPSHFEQLSSREKDIISLISKGESDKEISENLGISIHTAKTHRKRIIHKLGLKNSSTLVKYAVENGLC